LLCGQQLRGALQHASRALAGSSGASSGSFALVRRRCRMGFIDWSFQVP
jgi:hypothetical protein